MPYFLPSFFQKRLLRYALSRLELIDTDALDLDSLGITWGQRSVVELRDVGLRAEKLSSILQLPDSFDLSKANVRLLRVTVPADIYSSGITVEVEGVSMGLKLLPEDNGSRRRKDGSVIAREEKENKPRSPQPFVHDPGGDEHSVGGGIPTTADLAQSFLQAEPREEKEELQAAIASQSTYLQQSEYGSEDGEEELGIGAQDGISLPSFVAGFLKGVTDRLQISILDVVLRLEVEVPQDVTAPSTTSSKSDLVTGQLSFDELAIEGLTSSPIDQSTVEPRAGKRLVSLRQVRAALISDASVFSNYSRFSPSAPSTPSSPTQSKSAAPPRTAPFPSSPSPASTSSESSSPNLAMTRSTLFQPSMGEHDLDRSHSPSPLQESIVSESGRFSDAGTEEGVDYNYETRLAYGAAAYSHDETRSRNQDYTDYQSHFGGSDLTQSAYQEGLTDSQFEDNDLDQSIDLAFKAQTPQPGAMSSSRRSNYFSSSREPPAVMSSSIDDHGESETPQGQLTRRDSAGKASDTSASSGEDLSESKVFTHEEAESMYMSAMTQAPLASSGDYDIPGGWGSSERKMPQQSFQLPGRDTGLSTTEGDGTSTPKPEREMDTPVHETPIEDTRQYTRSNSSNFYTEREEPSSVSQDSLDTLAKEIFSVDLVSLWLPSDFGPSKEQPVSENLDQSIISLARSAFHTAPANAGVRFAEPMKPSRDSAGSVFGFDQFETKSPTPADDHSESMLRDGLEVEVSSSSVQCDLSIGRILTKLVQQLMGAWKPSETRANETKPGTNEQASASFPPLSVKVQDVCLKFLDHLSGTNPFQKDSDTARPSHSRIDDVLARANLAGISFSMASIKDVLQTRLDVAKFAIGHATNDILSFDKVLKMRESTRDILAPTEGDISLVVKKTKEHTDIQLMTLQRRHLSQKNLKDWAYVVCFAWAINRWHSEIVKRNGPALTLCDGIFTIFI